MPLLPQDPGYAVKLPAALRSPGRQGEVLPAPACSPGQKKAWGELRGSSPGIAANFLTLNQPGILAGHLGASSHAAKASDSPRSRGGFGCLPQWRARISVAEPLRALPASAGAGRESGDKRACVRLPAAGPADQPPAQLNRARFPCGRGTQQAHGPLPLPTSPQGPPPCGASPQAPALRWPSPGMNMLPWSPSEGVSSGWCCGWVTPSPSISCLPQHPGAHSTHQLSSRVLSIPLCSHSPQGLGQDETCSRSRCRSGSIPMPCPNPRGQCHIHLAGSENPSP